MLTIVVPYKELFDEASGCFIEVNKTTLQLEHSLISISKWESKWEKPFLSKEPKTDEQTLDYIKCMTLTQNVNPNVYLALSPANIKSIENYIRAPMTATWFRDEKKGLSREIITSELIYYWMIALNIPFECQKWHISRLLTLIRVCNIKNGKPKKMSKKEQATNNASLNAARRAATNSKG